jgi:cell wall-associated NlpC family hydrolase
VDLIGIRYKEGGSDPESGLDCYGCVSAYLNAELNIGLPAVAPPAHRWREYVAIYYPPLPPIQKYDILMFEELEPGLVNHIAVMVSQTDFIHAGSKYGGVVCEPLDRARDLVTAIGRPRDN